MPGPTPPKGSMKRLIICCDGSWQSANHGTRSVASNIAKISRAIASFGTNENGDAVSQIVYYDAGVGTTSDSEDGHESFGDWMSKMWGGAFGDGLSENVCEAYNFLADNYCSGDEVYVFGFSRGAYTARAVAGLVGQVGLCTSAMMEDFWAMYRAYRHREQGQLVIETRWGRQEGRAWLDGCTYPVDVRAVGVFDTVGSLGWPSTNVHDHAEFNKMHAFHDVNVHPNIKFAFQALAIDERRKPFSPTLWTLPKENTRTTLIQCWFPGVHINIGGGNSSSLTADLTEEEKDAKWKTEHPEQNGSNGTTSSKSTYFKPPTQPEHEEGDMETMANITFAWMVDLVTKCTGLTFDPVFMNALVAKYAATLSMLANMQGLGDDTTAHVEYRGWGVGAINDAFTGLKRLALPLMAENRKPGQYHDVGLTHEYIHPIVHFSLQQPRAGYKPAAFEGFEREPIPDGKAFAKFHPLKQVPETGKFGYYWEKKVKACSGGILSRIIPIIHSNEHDPEVAVIQIPEFQIPRDTGDFESMERKLILAKCSRSNGPVESKRDSKHADVDAQRMKLLEEDAVAGEKFLKQLDVENGY